jgi:hypothetical protein
MNVHFKSQIKHIVSILGGNAEADPLYQGQGPSSQGKRYHGEHSKCHLKT